MALIVSTVSRRAGHGVGIHLLALPTRISGASCMSGYKQEKVNITGVRTFHIG